MLEELRAAGLHIDRVAGVSLGSVVAAAAAAGFSTEGMADTFQRGFVDTNPTNDYVPPAYAMLRGVKTRKLIDESFGGRLIEELPLRFFCVSCDLVSREAVVHRDRPVIRPSTRASPSLACSRRWRPTTAGCSSTAACSTTCRSRRWPRAASAR